MTTEEVKVLLLAPYANPEGVGEAYSSYRWIKELSTRCDLTVLSQSPNATGLRAEFPDLDLTVWDDVEFFHRFGSRLNYMLKPSYMFFARRVRAWVRQNQDAQFDVIHQVSPLGLRYPCPVPSSVPGKRIIGPVAGSLPTPESLKGDVNESFLVRLRDLDGIRMSWDPMLRGTFTNADMVIGAAEYVRDILPKDISGRFVVMSEVGTDGMREIERPPASDGPVRLLFVGRLVGTKGGRILLDAMSRIVPEVDCVLDVVGDGPQLDEFAQHAASLNLGKKVVFHGRLPRREVDGFYEAADVFVLPSFREPSGNAVIEAMGWGLPVVVVDYGGPAQSVTDNCGVKVPLGSRESMVEGVATAIRSLVDDAELRQALGRNAAVRAGEFAWPKKAEAMVSWYHDVLNDCHKEQNASAT